MITKNDENGDIISTFKNTKSFISEEEKGENCTNIFLVYLNLNDSNKLNHEDFIVGFG